MSFALDPLHVFRFRVRFFEADLGATTDEDTNSASPSPVELCHGAFSEISGLEATMEPVQISEGGWNWGQHQRVGPTTFSTVILRRGLTSNRHLWTWFAATNRLGTYAKRMDVQIELQDASGEPQVTWTLKRALPIKLKLADLNAAGQEVGVEELHLNHEGLEELETPPPSSTPADGTTR